MKLISNRHITVQTVAKIHTMMLKNSYVSNIQCMITENYFIYHHIIKAETS
jgi:hypothetical protein